MSKEFVTAPATRTTLTYSEALIRKLPRELQDGAPFGEPFFMLDVLVTMCVLSGLLQTQETLMYNKPKPTIHPYFIAERNKYAPWGRGILQVTTPGTRAPYVLRKGNGRFDEKKP